jgi:hypothetical protein
MATEYRLACPITSYSHRLRPDAFGILMRPEAVIQISNLTESSFFVIARDIAGAKSTEDFYSVGHAIISTFLVALNIATLGLFAWTRNETHPFPQYSLLDPADPPTVKILLQKPEIPFATGPKDELTEEEIRKSALLFGALAREPVSDVGREYLKGLYHLTTLIYDVEFRKDAFGNFYRALEFFISDRVLRVRRLENELRDIQKALRDLGFSDVIVEEFRELYKIRSEQVMHAQRGLGSVDWEAVGKMKTFTDAVMHKVYQPVWEAGMAKQRAQSLGPDSNA